MAVDLGDADSIAAVEEVFWHAEARLRLKGGWWSYGRNRLTGTLEPARVGLRGDAFRGFQGKGAGGVLFAVRVDFVEKWRLARLNSSSCNRKY